MILHIIFSTNFLGSDPSHEHDSHRPKSMEVADEQLHWLERRWTFWFDNQSKPKQGAAWGTFLRKIYTSKTVEELCGVEPKWEDYEPAKDGKWTVTSSRKENLDSMWLETVRKPYFYNFYY
ncbi:hypothetical protein CDL12_20275 [Handroanthus impetiginosus]|uniref:Eukaryotic translation initiation factor isoform 4E n=1 Tax=Handroanthus impetiginosus TaxID=429701 RepID=A0A2G9GPM3_9LAMI|nr:hypothetical protein CDL12_20275 [Handroanthus impetiginosus]